jgi:hypothetical protein
MRAKTKIKLDCASLMRSIDLGIQKPVVSPVGFEIGRFWFDSFFCSLTVERVNVDLFIYVLGIMIAVP